MPCSGELAPPQLHSARQQGPPQIHLCSPGNQIPGDACTIDAYWQQRGIESDQGKSFCLPQLNPTGNDTKCQHPCVCLRELEDIVARPGEDPQDLVTCIKTLMDCCKMINDEHHEHKLHHCIVHAYHHEGKLLGKLMAKPFKTPSNELADNAVNHFTIQHAREQVSHSSNLWTQSARTKGGWSTSATIAMVTHHLHPPRTVPTAHNSTQPAEQAAWHMIPIVPNATRWDTGDQNAMVASHSNQGMHLHLGHSRGSPDAHLGTTITTEGGVTKQTP